MFIPIPKKPFLSAMPLASVLEPITRNRQGFAKQKTRSMLLKNDVHVLAVKDTLHQKKRALQ